MTMIKTGDRVKFASERALYRVRSADERFVICTRPFNPRKTVIYTIIDLEKNVRGPENLIFGRGAETDDQCDEMLHRLKLGETEVSQRRGVPLDIVRVVANA